VKVAVLIPLHDGAPDRRQGSRRGVSEDVLLTSIGTGQLVSRTGRYKIFPVAGTPAIIRSSLSPDRVAKRPRTTCMYCSSRTRSSSSSSGIPP
jgi:hypothetical protein